MRLNDIYIYWKRTGRWEMRTSFRKTWRLWEETFFSFGRRSFARLRRCMRESVTCVSMQLYEAKQGIEKTATFEIWRDRFLAASREFSACGVHTPDNSPVNTYIHRRSQSGLLHKCRWWHDSKSFFFIHVISTPADWNLFFFSFFLVSTFIRIREFL